MSTTTTPRIEDMDAAEARRVGLTIAEQQSMTPMQRARHAAAGRMVTPDMGDAPEGATHELVVPGAGLTIHIQGTDAEAQKLQLQWARKNGARIRRDGTPTYPELVPRLRRLAAYSDAERAEKRAEAIDWHRRRATSRRIAAAGTTGAEAAEHEREAAISRAAAAAYAAEAAPAAKADAAKLYAAAAELEAARAEARAAKERAAEAEERAADLADRVTALEERAAEAEDRAHNAEYRAATAEARADELEADASRAGAAWDALQAEAEDRAAALEERAEAAEAAAADARDMLAREAAATAAARAEADALRHALEAATLAAATPAPATRPTPTAGAVPPEAREWLAEHRAAGNASRGRQYADPKSRPSTTRRQGAIKEATRRRAAATRLGGWDGRAGA